jgi:L-threonylcarbamoyladenylate synthase
MPTILNTLSDKKLIELLANGAVGVLPTDTVYGLACSTANEASVRRLYALKNRDQKPGTIIAASTEQLVELGIKARYLKAVEQFWPNAISIIIPTGFDLGYLHLGKLSLAIRIPKDEKLIALLERTGPLLTSSANHPGEPEAATIDEAQQYFGDTIDFYVNGGDMSNCKPSTVIKIIDDAIEILREGAVKVNEKGEIEQ